MGRWTCTVPHSDRPQVDAVVMKGDTAASQGLWIHAPNDSGFQSGFWAAPQAHAASVVYDSVKTNDGIVVSGEKLGGISGFYKRFSSVDKRPSHFQSYKLD